MNDRFEFQVESVLHRHPTYVFARQITPGNVAVEEGSTLGGCPLQPGITMPRALDAAGQPRYDLFAFTLANGDDRARFVPGQIVELVARRLVEMRGFANDDELQKLFDTFGVFPDYQEILPQHLTDLLTQQHPALVIHSIELLQPPGCRLGGMEDRDDQTLVGVHELFVTLHLQLRVGVHSARYTLVVELVLKAEELERSPRLSTDFFVRKQIAE